MTTKRYETDRNYLACWHFCCSLTTRMRQRSTWYRGILIEQLTKQAIQDVRLFGPYFKSPISFQSFNADTQRYLTWINVLRAHLRYFSVKLYD